MCCREWYNFISNPCHLITIQLTNFQIFTGKLLVPFSACIFSGWWFLILICFFTCVLIFIIGVLIVLYAKLKIYGPYIMEETTFYTNSTTYGENTRLGSTIYDVGTGSVSTKFRSSVYDTDYSTGEFLASSITRLGNKVDEALQRSLSTPSDEPDTTFPAPEAKINVGRQIYDFLKYAGSEKHDIKQDDITMPEVPAPRKRKSKGKNKAPVDPPKTPSEVKTPTKPRTATTSAMSSTRAKYASSDARTEHTSSDPVTYDDIKSALRSSSTKGISTTELRSKVADETYQTYESGEALLGSSPKPPSINTLDSLVKDTSEKKSVPSTKSARQSKSVQYDYLTEADLKSIISRVSDYGYLINPEDSVSNVGRYSMAPSSMAARAESIKSTTEQPEYQELAYKSIYKSRPQSEMSNLQSSQSVVSTKSRISFSLPDDHDEHKYSLGSRRGKRSSGRSSRLAKETEDYWSQPAASLVKSKSRSSKSKDSKRSRVSSGQSAKTVQTVKSSSTLVPSGSKVDLQPDDQDDASIKALSSVSKNPKPRSYIEEVKSVLSNKSAVSIPKSEDPEYGLDEIYNQRYPNRPNANEISEKADRSSKSRSKAIEAAYSAQIVDDVTLSNTHRNSKSSHKRSRDSKSSGKKTLDPERKSIKSLAQTTSAIYAKPEKDRIRSEIDSSTDDEVIYEITKSVNPPPLPKDLSEKMSSKTVSSQSIISKGSVNKTSSRVPTEFVEEEGVSEVSVADPESVIYDALSTKSSIHKVTPAKVASKSPPIKAATMPEAPVPFAFDADKSSYGVPSIPIDEELDEKELLEEPTALAKPKFGLAAMVKFKSLLKKNKDPSAKSTKDSKLGVTDESLHQADNADAVVTLKKEASSSVKPFEPESVVKASSENVESLTLKENQDKSSILLSEKSKTESKRTSSSRKAPYSFPDEDPIMKTESVQGKRSSERSSQISVKSSRVPVTRSPSIVNQSASVSSSTSPLQQASKDLEEASSGDNISVKKTKDETLSKSNDSTSTYSSKEVIKASSEEPSQSSSIGSNKESIKHSIKTTSENSNQISSGDRKVSSEPTTKESSNISTRNSEKDSRSERSKSSNTTSLSPSASPVEVTKASYRSEVSTKSDPSKEQMAPADTVSVNTLTEPSVSHVPEPTVDPTYDTLEEPQEKAPKKFGKINWLNRIRRKDPIEEPVKEVVEVPDVVSSPEVIPDEPVIAINEKEKFKHVPRKITNLASYVGSHPSESSYSDSTPESSPSGSYDDDAVYTDYSDSTVAALMKEYPGMTKFDSSSNRAEGWTSDHVMTDEYSTLSGVVSKKTSLSSESRTPSTSTYSTSSSSYTESPVSPGSTMFTLSSIGGISDYTTRTDITTRTDRTEETGRTLMSDSTEDTRTSSWIRKRRESHSSSESDY